MSVRLVSTRDPSSSEFSYSEAVLQGLANDGGLFTPIELPRISINDIRKLGDAGYAELFTFIKQALVGDDLSQSDISAIASDSFSGTNFTSAKDDIITPLEDIGNGVYIQNLSLGPTAAFKDMAMQPLAREMNLFLERSGTSLRIVGATSGDTGPAAEAAFKDQSNIDLYMLSPHVGMSPFQKGQMSHLSGGNIHNISVKGRFDDCQDLVKQIMSDPDYADVGAVNSINWGRIASQIPYYFYGYLQLMRQNVGEEVDFIVPSGNFGNALAGHYARRMGLPIRKIVIATNENDILHNLIQTGEYIEAPAQITSSPSMDISKASNYERLVFEMAGHDADQTKYYMQVFSNEGRVALSDIGLSNQALKQHGFDSGRSSHSDRLATITRVHADTGIVVDPHTADAIKVARDQSGVITRICLATALPLKFESTVAEALGFTPERPGQFDGIERSSSGYSVIDVDLEQLKQLIN